MALFNFVDTILDTIFSPLFSIDPFWAILVITIIISFLMTIIYKYATDQKAMKRLKEKQKKLQKKMKESKDNPEKMMKIQKELMGTNSEYMKHSFKPMIFTFIPIIIIFGWLSTNFAYEPINPGDTFNTTVSFPGDTEGEVTLMPPQGIDVMSPMTQEIKDGVVTWELSGEEGDHVLIYEYGDETYSKNVKITEGTESVPNVKRKKGFIDYIYSSSDNFLDKDDSARQITIESNPLKVLPFKFIYWDGWLVTYILLSIIFSMVIRKVMKVS